MKISVVVPEDVTRETSNYMQRVLGPVAEFGDFCSEKLRFFRWKSAVRTIEKAQVFSKERKFKPQQIPIKFLVPFLENCSLEEEDSELTEEWAKLLSSASNDFKEKHLVYSNILSRIGPREAKILRDFWGKVDKEFFNSSASAYQAYGMDYAIQTESGRLKSDVHGKMSQDLLSNENAQKCGRFSVSQIGIASEIVEKPFPFSGPTDKRFSSAKGRKQQQGPSTKQTQIKENEESHESYKAALMILDKERLIILKSYSGKSLHSDITTLWAELTPLGFDFIETLEGQGI